MLHSAEIRWFLPESEMDAFTALFPKSSLDDGPETRTDVYRVVPGADLIGLKVRGDKGLELKALRAAPEDFRWTLRGMSSSPELVLGRTDLWVKWDLPERNGEKLMANGREVSVEKVRWLRSFSMEGGRVQPVPAHGLGPEPDSGCNVERTELTVGQEQWLSLGFEAFGDPAQIRGILAETVRLVLQNATPAEIQKLAGACSQSYPVWLDAYIKRAAASSVETDRG
jgi:hypothetical protein